MPIDPYVLPQKEINVTQPGLDKLLHKIGENWLDVVQDFCITAGDAPYAYNEAASVSLLNAAIWWSEGVGLQEYAAMKRCWQDAALPGGRRRLADKRGRVDQYARFDSFDLVFESKQLWVRKSSDVGNGYRKALKAATQDVRKVTEKAEKIACVFIVPKVKAQSSDGDIVELHKSIVATLENTKPSFYAWVYPEGMCDVYGKTKAGTKYVWPGVYMILSLPRGR